MISSTHHAGQIWYRNMSKYVKTESSLLGEKLYFQNKYENILTNC